MTETGIALSPQERNKPRRARIPIGLSQRWRSLDETNGYTPALSIFVSPHAFVRFCAHAGSDLNNEVGGWLVGKWRADRDTGQPYIIIEATLPARFTRHGGTFLTFTQESQVALYSEFQERYPNKDLVGWYHSHPGMGIFLSSYDTWLHRNFFPELFQVALVIEPYTMKGGFFIRDEQGELDATHYCGFFELSERRRSSVVHWQNLFLDSHLSPKGDPSLELGEKL